MDIRNIWIIYLRHVRKNRIMLAALLIVAAISVFLIYIAFYEWNRENYNIYMTRQLLGDVPDLYNISLATVDADQATELAVEEFLLKLPEVEGVAASGRQMSTRGEWIELMENEAFLETNMELLAGTIGEAYPTLINIHCIDKELLDTVGLSGLMDEDVTDTVPVLVGYNFRKIFTVGEVYTDNISKCQYRIAGFLPKGFRLPPEMPLYSELYIDADDGMAAIYDKRLDPDHMQTLNARNSMYFISDGSDQVREQVNLLAEACGLHVKICTIEEMISEYKDENKESIAITFLFTGIAVLAGFIAIVSSSIIRILLNKQEYGILYANGVSFADTFKMIMLDNAVKLLTALLAAFVAASWYIKSITLTDLEESLRMLYIRVVPEVSVIVLGLWVLSTVVPVYILSRMHVVDLLGGNEL